LTQCYSLNQGRPADDPVLLVKLEYLQFHYNLSDREVIAAAQVNVAFRFLLDLALASPLPHPSLLRVFRARLGEEQHQQLVDGIVNPARAYGLVKDRLRLKDATQVLANIAIPSTIRLVAETRQRLLDAARPLAADGVAAEESKALQVRAVTAARGDDERLLQRVTHLRQIVAWTDRLHADLGPLPALPPPERLAFAEALQLAHKVLADRDDPDAGDKLVSLQDPDARRGKHGAYFTGYLLDVAMDAASEIVTAVNLVPANGDEAADATTLISQEEQAQGNDVQALSIDGLGFRGDLLREWQDPAGLQLEVFVPPPPLPAPTPYFTPDAFQLDGEGRVLTCPGGHQTTHRSRNEPDTGWKYYFKREVCAACPLQAQCLARLPKATGRTVIKNDYVAEYAAARHKAATPTYEAVRRQHPHIERKLAELVQRHGARRARFRGRLRAKIQYLLTGMAVNIKRIVHLMDPARCAAGIRQAA
jgi:transposase